MYDIYIKNYANSSGVVQTAEALLYSIPLTSTYKDNILIDPIVKTEMGKAGTLEFAVHPDHPYYNCWQQMKTVMRIVYDGTTIFRGRVLTIDNTLFGDKKIHCESDFAFLMDSFQIGTKEETRTEITILAYLQQIINAHNTQMSEANESDKYFTLGEVPGQYTNATSDVQRVKADPTKKYGSDSWSTSMSALETLQKQYGGYFRTRYVNGTTYLDWLDNYFNQTTNTQYIEIGENLIDFQNSSEVENIFTALIPIGSKQSEEVLIDGYKTDIHGANNNRILVPQIVSQFTDAELNSGYHAKADYQNAVNKYGIIYKTQKFENADTPEKLWEYACDYILRNYIGGITSFTLTAIDMHHINGVVVKYLVGDRIPVRYPDLDNRANGVTPIISKILTATSISYNLHNPEKNSYSIGIPNSLVEKKYGSANGKGGGGGGGAGGNNDIEEDDFKKAYDHDKSENGVLAWRYVIDAKYNNEEYQKLLAEDPNLQWAPKALKTGKVLVKGVLDDTTQGKKMFDSIIAGAGKLEMKPNLNLVYASNPDLDRVAQTASSLVFDAYNGSVELREKYVEGKLIDAGHNLKTMLELGATPTHAKLKSWLPDHGKESQTPILAAMLDGSDGTISSIISKLGLDGSGEKATIFQDGLTSMLKFFNPSTASSSNPTETVEFDGTNGKGKVGKDSNSNWQIKLNETITYNDENGNQQTAAGFVSAKDFNIPSVASFKTKLLVVDDLIAGKATIGELNAVKARIQTLETDALTAQNIEASYLSTCALTVSSLATNAITGTTLTLTSSLHAGNSFLGYVFANGNDITDPLVNASVDGDTLTLTKASGSTITFEKGPGEITLSGAWTDDWTRYTVIAKDKDGNQIGDPCKSGPVHFDEDSTREAIKRELESSSTHTAVITATADGEALATVVADASGVYTQGQTATINGATVSQGLRLASDGKSYDYRGVVSGSFSKTGTWANTGTVVYTNGQNSVTISSVESNGTQEATATSISVIATASNGNTGTGSIDISTQRTNAYNSGSTATINGATVSQALQLASDGKSYNYRGVVSGSFSKTGEWTNTGTVVYENGWSGSYNAIGISATSSTATYGDTITIYPTGKSSSTASAGNITSKKFTYTVPADRYSDGRTATINGATVSQALQLASDGKSYNYRGVVSGSFSKTGEWTNTGTVVYTNGQNSVTISSVEANGTQAATATSISVKATASNGATGTGDVNISSQRTNAYNAGWAAAAAKFRRSGNTVYGPSATAGGSDRSYTASYTASSYTASSYSASYYKASTHSYRASSYTASSATQIASNMWQNYVPSTYSQETHSYTASSYVAEEYTASSYTASSFSWS